MSEPRQPSLRRLRQFGVRPKRDLGQNFLVDSNILGVIERAAELGPDDVVLEIGGGLGVLSEHLAPRAAHVHVVEVDRSLEAPLRDALEPFANTTLHIADAMDLDLRALDPAPTKVVANLPYGIAAGAILRTIEELPERHALGRDGAEGGRRAVRRGARHAGLRRAVRARAAGVRRARPAAGLAQRVPPRAQRRLGARRAWRARAPAPEPALRALVQAAFAHRRKALAGSLALAAGAPPGVRDAARAALVEMGHPADVRAERLSPEDFRALHEALS